MLSEVIKFIILVFAVFLIELIIFSDIFTKKLTSLVPSFASKDSTDCSTLNFVGSITVAAVAVLAIVLLYVLILNL